MESTIYTRIKSVFDSAQIVSFYNIKLLEVAQGFCRTALEIQPKFYQQDGVVQGGVYATLIGQTSAGSALSQLNENESVMGVEFKVNLLAACSEGMIYCECKNLKLGQRIIFVEAQVYNIEKSKNILATASVTLARNQKQSLAKNKDK
jgi:uncharacterized protein (TIGR00369 family)